MALQGLPAALTGADRPLIMGILNVTPDSFSDGGEHLAAEAAIAHGLAMQLQGADIVDVGGESTRPGAQRITAGEEQDRVLPVVVALAQAGVAVSIDTMRASTAVAAVRGTLQTLGFPVLVGASRKRFLGSLLAEPKGAGSGEPRGMRGRDPATDAVSALASAAGAWGVRVHDVANSRDAVLVGRAWARGCA